MRKKRRGTKNINVETLSGDYDSRERDGRFSPDGFPLLTPREKRFVEEYLIDMNAHGASVRAGYTKKQKHQGTVLMKRPHIKMAISEAMKEREERTKITQDDVVQELARIAFFDIGNLYDDNNNFKGLNRLNKNQRKYVKVSKYPTQYGERTTVDAVDNRDKLKALELLGKHFGMFQDKLHVTNEQNIKLSVEVDDLRQRGISKNDLLNLRSLLEGNCETSDGNGRKQLTI